MTTMGIAATLLATHELRAGSTITETEIHALKVRLMGHQRRMRGHRDLRLRDKNADAYNVEWKRIVAMLPMRVSDEQGKKGLDYLRKLLVRKDGMLRNTKLVRDQNLTDDHLMLIRRADHFLFVGFREDLNTFGNVAAIYPIYRLVASDGWWFEYVARPWVGGPCTFSPVNEEMPS